MSAAASKYYTDLSRGLQAADVHQWEIEVTAAESLRMTDRAAMDIIGARKNVSVVVAEESHPPLSRGTVFHWIKLGLELEEQQWVCFSRNALGLWWLMYQQNRYPGQGSAFGRRSAGR